MGKSTLSKHATSSRLIWVRLSNSIHVLTETTNETELTTGRVVIVAHMAPNQSQGSILSYSFVSALENNGILPFPRATKEIGDVCTQATLFDEG